MKTYRYSIAATQPGRFVRRKADQKYNNIDIRKIYRGGRSRSRAGMGILLPRIVPIVRESVHVINRFRLVTTMNIYRYGTAATQPGRFVRRKADQKYNNIDITKIYRGGRSRSRAGMGILLPRIVPNCPGIRN
jgi:hypothetical protein